MKEFETGAVRDTGGKGRMDLLPMCALLRVSKHMEDALTHYPERNWEQGLPMHTMVDSALRHLAKYVDGRTDEDHLCAAATNLLMALWTEEKRPDMQDIPSRLTGAAPLAQSDGDCILVPPGYQVQKKATERPEEASTESDFKEGCKRFRVSNGVNLCSDNKSGFYIRTCKGDPDKCDHFGG